MKLPGEQSVPVVCPGAIYAVGGWLCPLALAHVVLAECAVAKAWYVADNARWRLKSEAASKSRNELEAGRRAQF